jgi:serine/threonine protein kinase
MKPIAPNTLIQNRYLIVHLIGKGGMGEVYLAVDQRLGSAIALKRTFFSDDATLGSAFEREARTLARLRHPVLPKVSDHFTEDGTQYLVMEHISGDDISKRLEGMEKPFPLSWVLFWADQLLDALTYLHTHEPPIIHRDIKPQNLKLTDENHIVLLDFGLSKNTIGETRATTTGSVVGYTPHYAPMEQIRGTGTDARSDIYSLSATLYQILTIAVPPDALTRADSLINGMPDPIKPISELNVEVSKAVSDVIVKGMAISQDQRYKTAREMQKALRDAYAQLQSDMSANTVAFTKQSEAETPQSQLQTAVFPDSSNSGKLPSENLTSPRNQHSSSNLSNSSFNSSKPTNNTKTEPDFDATIRYDEELEMPPAKQSAIETEIFLAGSSDAITSAQKGEFKPFEADQKASDFHEDEDFSAEDSFADEMNFSAPANYSPDATVPLINFGSEINDAAQPPSVTEKFDSLPKGDTAKSSAAATFVTKEKSFDKKEEYKPTPAVASPKKSSSKALAIGGGLFALLILAVGAAGIGWFMLKDKGKTTENFTPSPTPEATLSVAPTAQPTLEVINDTNTASNTEVVNSDTNTNTASTNENTSVATTNPTNPANTTRQTQNIVVQPTPVRVATPRQTPQAVAVKTPQTAKTPVASGTPKVKRTDILQ